MIFLNSMRLILVLGRAARWSNRHRFAATMAKRSTKTGIISLAFSLLFFFYTKVQPDAINISVSNNTTFMVITEGDLHGTEKVCFPSLKKVLKTSTKKPNNAKTWVTRTPVKIFIRHKIYRYLPTLLFTVPSLRPH